MNGIPRTVYIIHYTENGKESVMTFASKKDASPVPHEQIRNPRSNGTKVYPKTLLYGTLHH